MDVCVCVFLSGTRSHIVEAEHEDVDLGAQSDLMVHVVSRLRCSTELGTGIGKKKK